MTFNYTKSQSSALTLLTKFGETITRRTYTADSYNPATGASDQTTADTSRAGVLLNMGNGEQFFNGNLIIAGDKKLLLDGSAASELTDRYIVDGVEYSVISINELKPAGVIVMYTLHLRVM